MTQSVSPNSPKLSPKVENSSPRRYFSKTWLFVPLFVTPFIVAASAYSSTLQVHQTSEPVYEGVSEVVNANVVSSLELELALTQRDAFEKKYHATIGQLQATEDLHAELQTAYQDAQDLIDSLKRQNQQLQALASERSPLLAQVEKLQGVNKELENQVGSQKQQSATLANRLDRLEIEKQELVADKQQLQLADRELKTLKPELKQARWAIAQLSSQLNQKPEQMATINVNGKPFLVPQELADAIETERKQVTVKDNSSAIEIKP
jgi:predicted RNase H-like nuclease (RuvC/YqgF family)